MSSGMPTLEQPVIFFIDSLTLFLSVNQNQNLANINAEAGCQRLTLPILKPTKYCLGCKIKGLIDKTRIKNKR